MIKKIILYIFIYFVFICNLFLIDVKADEKDVFLDYLLTQTSVSDIKTTIIPNCNIVEDKDSLKMINLNITSENNINDNSATFVIQSKTEKPMGLPMWLGLYYTL